ncbi:protein CLN8-like [Tubulanus polymorphus]|uniref:protein CLN8-like n=1 Tax=Tubulanus polymorphus TaxID=672921 RepID=UPI003DA3E184
MQYIGYLHPSLSELDYYSSSVKAAIVGLSTASFFAVYLLSAVLAQWSWTYRNLRAKEKIFWNLTVMRGAFGIFGTLAGIWITWFDDELYKDVVFGTNATSHFILLVSVGFFVIECLVLTYSDVKYNSFNYMLHLHHWLALSGYLSCIVLNSAHYFACVALMLEITTPFSCICWTLLKCGFARTKLWKLNQLVLVHLFHCRTLIEAFIFIQSWRNWSTIWSSMPWSNFLILHVGLVISFLYLTPYWTYKKTTQLVNPVDWNFEDSDRTRVMNGHVCKGE